MKSRIGIAAINTVVFMFLVLYISDYIKPFFDPRYLLLVIVLILGALTIAFGISILSRHSIGANITDILVNFEYSSLFFILFGLFIVIIALLGLINGPESIGMETLTRVTQSKTKV